MYHIGSFHNRSSSVEIPATETGKKRKGPPGTAFPDRHYRYNGIPIVVGLQGGQCVVCRRLGDRYSITLNMVLSATTGSGEPALATGTGKERRFTRERKKPPE